MNLKWIRKNGYTICVKQLKLPDLLTKFDTIHHKHFPGTKCKFGKQIFCMNTLELIGNNLQ